MRKMTPTELSERLWKELAPSAFAFVGLASEPQGDVPMTMHIDHDNRKSLWIFTVKQSRLVATGPATARFISPHVDLFARLSGMIAIETDNGVIDRLWNRQIAAWYVGGRDDPDLAVVRLDVEQAEIWTSDMSPLTTIKMLVGANVHDDMQSHHATVPTP